MARIRNVIVLAAGLATAAAAWLGPPASEAGAACLHVAHNAPMVATTVRVGSCPTTPPQNEGTPCPGSAGKYEDPGALFLETEILVCL